MKILITTGIYPPKIGGPAQYAKNLAAEFKKMGHETRVKTYELEDKLPTGIRHLYFFFKIIPELRRADAVFALDTFSVGLPTVLAGRIFGKSVIIRTGGDFLWEQYGERTKKKVLLKDFYDTETGNFSLKEKLVFAATKWTLNNAAKVIFSTAWQRDIFAKAYSLDIGRTASVENYYGEKESDFDYESMELVGSTRKLVLKNLDLLEEAFAEAKESYPEASLFLDNLPYEEFMQKLGRSYASVLVSLGDISPNMILDSIRLNRPFICTRELGIYERVKDAGVFVDPLDKESVKQAILEMLTPEGYWRAKEKVRNFSFTHTWGDIAREFLQVFESAPKPKKTNFVKNIFDLFIAVRYVCCGLTSAALNISVLYVFTDVLGVWYLYSSVVAFLVSVVVSFGLQKFVVFEDRETEDVHAQFSKFFVVILLGVLTNTFLVYIFTDILGVWYLVSQVLAGFIVMFQNFLSYKFIIFNRNKN